MTDRALRLPLALTMGDPAGIGPELALRAWLARDSAAPPFFVLADPSALAELARRFDFPVPIAETTPTDSVAAFARALPVVPLAAAARAESGASDPASAAATIESIERAVGYVKAGVARAVETMSSCVNNRGTSLTATWMVIGETASAGDQINITGCASTPQSRAASAPRYSVWPGNLKPAA